MSNRCCWLFFPGCESRFLTLSSVYYTCREPDELTSGASSSGVLLLTDADSIFSGLNALICHNRPAYGGFLSSQTSLSHWAAGTSCRLISCLSSNQVRKIKLGPVFHPLLKRILQRPSKTSALFVIPCQLAPYWPVKECWGQRWAQRSPQPVVLC